MCTFPDLKSCGRLTTTMARMQNVDSDALKKPILGGGGGGSNNGATATNNGGGGASGSGSGIHSIMAAQAGGEDGQYDNDLMEERADRKKTNWRLLGLSKAS